MLLPSPIFLGLPEKFNGWRPGQDAAVVAALDSSKRFIAINAPTGFGKTPTNFAIATLGGFRAAFLTASKGLQSQLLADFGSCGLVDIRGQNNYPCRALGPDGIYYGQGIAPGVNCDAGPCHVGRSCSARNSGCYYFDAVQLAKQAQYVTTNYSYWIAQHRYSDGLGKFDLLVLDEAHDAPDELAQSLKVDLSEYDVATILGRNLPHYEDSDAWRSWATLAAQDGQLRLDKLEALIKYARDNGQELDHATLREAHALKNLLKRIQVVAQMQGHWVVERRLRSASIAPVWPIPYAEQRLFLGIKKVVLVSATVKEKTLELLGVQQKDFEFLEYPSTFPLERRPVVHIPSVRCNHTWSEIEQRTWVRRIDQIISKRLDRKGIIHTTSYERRNLVLTWSEHRRIMLFNDTANIRTTVEEFRQASPPSVLVSPSMVTGWDLPFDECEYAIIGKIPFPDTRSPITKARTTEDASYGPYLAMQAIVQASGRGMRSAGDQCEVFVVDDQWRWFWKKFKRFAPRWFQEAVSYSLTIPDPLPKLKSTTKETSHA